MAAKITEEELLEKAKLFNIKTEGMTIQEIRREVQKISLAADMFVMTKREPTQMDIKFRENVEKAERYGILKEKMTYPQLLDAIREYEEQRQQTKDSD